MPDVEIARLADRLMRRLHGALNATADDFDRHRLGPGGGMLLLTVAEAEPARLQDVVRAMARDKAQLTRGVQGLERKGLLARRVCPDDGRATLLPLTEAGREAVDLMEHWRVGRVPVIAIDTARRDNADGRLIVCHRADLHRARVRAQDFRSAAFRGFHKECVVGFARRGAFWEVQRGEIVPVIFNVGAFGDGEAHIAENGGDFLEDLHDGMQGADLLWARRQGHVQLFSRELGLKRGGLERGFAGFNGVCDPVFQRIELWTHVLALFRAHLAECFHKAGDTAFFAEFGDTNGVESVQVTRVLDRRDGFRFDGLKFGHKKPRRSGRTNGAISDPAHRRFG